VPANRHLFIGDLIQLDVQLEIGSDIRFTVNCVTEGACLLVTRCNFSCQLCPLDTPLHMYIFYEINETHELFPKSLFIYIHVQHVISHVALKKRARSWLLRLRRFQRRLSAVAGNDNSDAHHLPGHQRSLQNHHCHTGGLHRGHEPKNQTWNEFRTFLRGSI